MFNQGWITNRFTIKRVTRGTTNQDFDTYSTLFAGPDPADSNRVLIRKIVQVSPTTYCLEETRITPKGEQPIVHTVMFRLKDLNLKEALTPEEIQIRGAYRALPNVMGFSLFYKRLKAEGYHISIVENTLNKASGSTWTEFFQDLRDRRDISSYIKLRWILNG